MNKRGFLIVNILLILIPAVSALTFYNDENYIYIDGKYSDLINIHYKDNPIPSPIHLSVECGNCRDGVCEGECRYSLNVLDRKLDENYYFHVEDIDEGIIIFQFKEVEGCETDDDCEEGEQCVDRGCEEIIVEKIAVPTAQECGHGAIIDGVNFDCLAEDDICVDIVLGQEGYCFEHGCIDPDCGEEKEIEIEIREEKIPTEEIKSGEINVKTFYFLRKETKPVAKIAGESDFYKNNLPSEKHPVVLYTNNEIETIRDRITRQPYSGWWERIMKEGRWIVNYDLMSWNRIQKAKYAKIMAFIYVVTEEEKYGNKTRDILLKMNFGGFNKEHFEDIDSLAYFSEAYDMLKGANYDFDKEQKGECLRKTDCKTKWSLTWSGGFRTWEECKESYNCDWKIRKELKKQMEQVATTSYGEIFFNTGDSLTRKNNHHIRRYSAVGIAALVLANDREAKEAFDKVMSGGTTASFIGKTLDWGIGLFSDTVSFEYKGVQDAMNHQIVSNDGGWREGPHYMAYSFTTGIPFMKAMKNAGVENNWLEVEKLQNTLITWPLAISMPNGAMPPIDDSNLDTSYSYSGYFNNKEGNWLWEKSNYFTFWDDAWMKIDAIAYYDDTMEEEPSLKPTQYLPKTGIFFRSDWNEEGIYLGFFGENGRSIDDEAFGITHEHTDTMSFILYAYGKYLALDSGYINWDNRDKVSKPENHNVILIDNNIAKEGSPIESDFFTTDYLDYGKIKNNLGHERGILFIDKKYFLVFDVLKSSYNRDYKWLLHGNGNFINYNDGKAEWVQDNVGLLVKVLPGSATISSGEAVHCNDWPKVETHTYLSAFEMGKNVGFLSLLYPAKNKDYPEVYRENNQVDILRLEKDDWKGIAFVNENNKFIEVDNIRTDASKLFVKIKNNKVDYIFADDITQLSLDGKNLIDSNEPTTISIKFIGNDLEIYYKDNADIELNKNPTKVLYNNNENNELYSDGVVNL